ncbi:MAG: hypothetical protein JXX28_19955 [Deltaproteobacteria bacterium]|nr:hypothetical protein [Deltaproteobacteria bacterium]
MSAKTPLVLLALSLLTACDRTVSAQYWQWDDERACWERIDEEREARYWAATHEECGDVTWHASDSNGHCLLFAQMCADGAPIDDPDVLSCGASTVPDCCTMGDGPHCPLEEGESLQ